MQYRNLKNLFDTLIDEMSEECCEAAKLNLEEAKESFCTWYMSDLPELNEEEKKLAMQDKNYATLKYQERTGYDLTLCKDIVLKFTCCNNAI